MLEILVQKVGLLGIVAFLAMAGVGLPIPEEAPLVLAGAASRRGAFEPQWAFLACLVGALVGDSIMYCIGRHFGHGLLQRHPWMSRFINAEEEEKIEHVVHRHGFKILLGTRFLIGVRGAVYFAAGAARVPYLKFLLWDTVAATLVVGIVFGLGYAFGEWIADVVNDAEKLLTVFVVLGLLVVGIYFYRKRVERIDQTLDRMEQEVAEPEPSATADPNADSGPAADEPQDKSA